MAPERARMLAVVAVLPARDVEKALAFYERELGFERVFEVDEPPVYAGVRRGGAELHFYRSDHTAAGEWANCRVRVHGIEALHADCAKRKIADGGLETKPWGFREFSVADPHGVVVTFYEVPGPEITFERNGRH